VTAPADRSRSVSSTLSSGPRRRIAGMVDRYTKVALTVIALALVALVFRPLLGAGPADAQSPPRDFSQKTVVIPREWGRFVGVSDKLVYFEASDGQIRRQNMQCIVCDWVRK
jgi:hypothetical protein